MPSVCWVSTHSRCMELIWWLPSSAARSAAAVTASSERVVNWNSTGLLPWGAGVDEVMRGPGTAASYVVQRVRVESIPLKVVVRSEEHTSELQSRGHLVCRLLLEKKKRKRRLLKEN